MRHARFVIPAALALVAAGLVPLASAAGASSTPAAPAAVAPQAATRLASVTGLEAAPSARGERLHWTNPAGPVTSLVVRRAPGSIAPATPTSGSSVGSLAPGSTDLIDASVQAKTVYSYSVFAMYSSGRHATPAVHEARTSAVTVQPATNPHGSFTGKVTDADGNALKGVIVQVIPAQPVLPDFGPGGFSFVFFQPQIARTAADGTYTISGVNTASYTVCFTASTQLVTGGDSTSLGYADLCPQDAVEGHAGAATSLGTTVLAGNAGGLVSGLVVDGSSNQPLADVQLEPELPNGPIAFATTGAGGKFRFGLPAGTYDFCFDAEFATGGSSSTGYESGCRDDVPVVVTPGQVTQVTFPVAIGGAISGVVRSSVDGSPVAGIDVEAQSSDAFADATTADDGSYTLTGLPSEHTQICVYGLFSPPIDSSSLGWGTACGSAKPKIGKTVSAPDIVVDPAGGVSGRVTTTAGHPLGGAAVTISGRKWQIGVLTAADGTYTATEIPAGTYVVCFSASTYPPQCYRDRDPGTNPTRVKVVSGVMTTGVDGVLAGKAPGSVTVTVQDSHGNPLVGADVALVQRCVNPEYGCQPVPVFADANNNQAGSELTGADGTYTFTEVSPGKYAACAFGRFATGGPSTTRYIDGCSDTVYSTVLTAGGTASATITLADGAAVSGTVTDRQGHPLSGVVAMATTGDAQELGNFDDEPVTGQDGTYRIEGLPAGTTGVCFDATLAVGPSPTGYADQCYDHSLGKPTPVPVASGSVTTGIDAQLRPGAVISGTVTDANDQPVAGVNVDIGSYKTGDMFVQTDSNGAFRIAGLEAGDYIVCFEAEGIAGPPTGYVDQCWDNVGMFDGPTTITLTAGQVVTGIDATLQTGAELTGQVTSGGQPLGDGVVELRASGASGPGFQFGTEIQDGFYDLTGIAAGKYVVCFDGTFAGAGAQCYNGVVWKGGGHVPPAGVTKVPLAAGQTLEIDVDLG